MARAKGKFEYKVVCVDGSRAVGFSSPRDAWDRFMNAPLTASRYLFKRNKETGQLRQLGYIADERDNDS